MVRAIADAETLVHADAHATVDAVTRALPKLDRKKVEALVGLYANAIPDSPSVSAAAIAPAREFYPASGGTAPSLEGIDLAAFVDTRFASDAPLASSPPHRNVPLALWLALVTVLLGSLVAVRELRTAKR
jgi:hypothetical protein